MQRIGILAVLAVVSLTIVGCHRKPPPPPPAVPRSSPPAATNTKTRRNRTTPQGTARQATGPAGQPNAAPAGQPGAAVQTQPAYRLGQALTPEEVSANNTEIDRRLQHARHVLATVTERGLSSEQRSTLSQIREFIAQAQEMRRTDVVGARSLAERADVLATDLQSSVK